MLKFQSSKYLLHRNLSLFNLVPIKPIIRNTPSSVCRFSIFPRRKGSEWPVNKHFYTSFISRRLSSIKNTLIRQRKWGIDDIMALSSWIFLANGVLLLAGTTTYVSMWLGFLQNIPFQDDIVQMICQRVIRDSDFSFSFENTQLRFNTGHLRLNNVKLKRNANQLKQITEFEVSIEEVDVKLSLLSWINGTGLLRELRVNGVQGTVNRRHLDFTNINPYSWLTRKEPSPDDITITRLTIENMDLRVLDANNFRPYSFVIHRADMKRFRTQWMLLDFLLADNVAGEYDGALFNLTRIKSAATDADGIEESSHRLVKFRMPNLAIDMVNTGVAGAFGWIKSGFVDIDMLISVPVLNGDSMDLGEIGHFKVIGEELEDVTAKMIQEVYQNVLDRQHMLKLKLGHMSPQQKSILFDNQEQQQQLEQGSSSSETTQTPAEESQQNNSGKVEIFLDLRFNHVRAVIPDDQNADVLMRTVVAYLNSQPTTPRNQKTSTPPLSVFISLPYSNFDGAATIYQCGFVDEVANKASDALIKQVTASYRRYEEKGRMKNIRSEEYRHNQSHRQGPSAGLVLKVVWWGLQQVSKAAISFWEGADTFEDSDGDAETLSEVYDQFSRGR